MNYDLIVNELKTASSFNLYRLVTVINQLLEDPVRLAAIKRSLRPGMEASYFHAAQNRLVPVRVLEVRRTRAAVQELQTGEKWTVPLYMINVDEEVVQVAPQRGQVDRLSLRIGEMVGFKDRDGIEVYGRVVKLNPKRAKILTPRGTWAVPYNLLFSVIDGEGREQSGAPLVGVEYTVEGVEGYPPDDK